MIVNAASVIRHRITQQQLAGSCFTEPQALVRWFGAIQAQDYAMAKWAIALRLDGKKSTDAAIEQAFNAGHILRTHVLRPTWHFVAPADIRWMLKLSAPRVRAANSYMHRQLGVDPKLLKKSSAIIAKALTGARHLTRAALDKHLRRNGIIAEGPKLAYLFMHAELDGLICSGSRAGRQFTYALLDERVPLARDIDSATAPTELARRYFSSHGPATVHDFSWWSGLTIRDARAAAESLGGELAREQLAGSDYFFRENTQPVNTIPKALLLPKFDEYGIAYKDRSALFARDQGTATSRRAGDAYNQTVVASGKILGSWSRIDERSQVTIAVRPNVAISKEFNRAIEREAQRYGTFLGKPVVLTYRRL